MRPGRQNGKSYQDAQEVVKIMQLLRGIFEEVDNFTKQIVSNNFDEETVMHLSTKVGMSRQGTMTSIEVYNNATHTVVIFDMTIFDMLNLCSSKTLEGLLNEKVIAMVRKSMSTKRQEEIQTMYLEHSIS